MSKPNRRRTLTIWGALTAIFVVLLLLMSSDKPEHIEDFATFSAQLDEGRVSAVVIEDDELVVTLDSGEEYLLYAWPDQALLTRLAEQRVYVEWSDGRSPLTTLLIVAIPLLLLIGAFLYFLRRMQGGGAGANILELRKSRARQLSGTSNTTFADVAGCEEAKLRLADVIDYLQHPTRWSDAGVRLPKGVLLVGPPGCGKTLLARAVAGEAGVPFFFVSASEFVEMFVGVGAARIRDMFDEAIKAAPAVVFIDELDAVGRRRGSGVGSAHDEREQTLNQLLVNLDGFDTDQTVVVLAATNRPDVLDKALTRPGRFDAIVKIPELEAPDWAEVLRIHTKNKSLAPEVELLDIANQAKGMTGAELEHLANEAALRALRRVRENGEGAVLVERRDFLDVMQARKEQGPSFDKLDAAMVESASQLVRPSGAVVMALDSEGGESVEGELLWADGVFVKLRCPDGTEPLVPKQRVVRMRALEGTEAASAEEVVADVWAGHQPDLA